ncbi:hypothetical protein SAMN02745866_04308 [Alteromonadaceae bacterium Bs31]|nr:hypothetical protein SAMN02745866_04308 [Alteromonadaceae bacterium Bs31]
MTPSLFYKVAKKVEKSQNQLGKAGLIVLLLFLSSALANALLFDMLYAIVLAPLGVLFFLLGLGMLPVWYKDKEEQKELNFDGFWQANSFIGKLFLWYSAVFLSFWLLGVSIVILFSVVHTVAYVLFS